MPWPKDHKSRTRQRILHAAAEVFRSRGVSAVSVEEIMASAGLTHGAFYAYFDSKDELLSKAVEYAAAETINLLSQSLNSVPTQKRIQVMTDYYLSSTHAAHPERGCPIAALGPELSRSGKKLHSSLARAVKSRIEWMRSLLSPSQRETISDAQLTGAFACMVGGLILARSVPAKDSEAILEACREFLHGAVSRSPLTSSS